MLAIAADAGRPSVQDLNPHRRPPGTAILRINRQAVQRQPADRGELAAPS